MNLLHQVVSYGTLLLSGLMTGPEQQCWQACLEGNLEKVVVLIEQQSLATCITNDRGETLLHVACAHNHLPIVKYLISKEVAVDALDNSKATPLFHAVRKNHHEIVAHLIRAGALVTRLDGTSNYPLTIAVANRHLQTVEVLLVLGQAVQEMLIVPMALLLAIELDAPELVERLVPFCATIENETSTGMTPLIYASIKGNAPLATLILSRGEKIFKKDVQGLSALDYARIHGNNDIELLLINTYKQRRKCATCGGSKNLMKCDCCCTVYYCNRRCQKKHWPKHKPECRSPLANWIAYHGIQLNIAQSVSLEDYETTSEK